ncbi:MAG: Cof-type HAD-IIB family hydrolase [Lachnospiraceae bacterium]|nr:Cof-type HAD-IIB family hydrolase [Lachnospiraceae bacterium]
MEEKVMIKAVFFDIDGTLIPLGSKQMSAETIQALKELKERGIKIFLASGRGVRELGVITKDVSFDGYITLNGQICLGEDFELYYGNPIHADDLKVLLKIFEEKKLHAVIIEEKRSYINFIDDVAEKIHQEIGVKASPIESYEGDAVYQVILYADAVYAEELFQELPHCKWSRWHPKGIDVFSKDGGKVTGIQKTLEHFDIKQEETMAFGDGDNDVDMLKFVQIGVAMGNAQEQTKEAADYVTGTTEEGGITKALKHFELIQNN